MRRQRPTTGDAESEPRTPFAVPVPAEPRLERDHDAFLSSYHPNSAFLAQLIATRDAELIAASYRPSQALSGANTYRATAARPRQRPAGHVLSTVR